MDLSEYGGYDIRKTNMTKSELIACDKYNSIYRTLWFANP